MSSRKRTSEKESTETATGVAEASSAEVKTEGPSFAERVGQKQYPKAPDPFSIAIDKAAGVSLFESKQDRQMAIKFGEGRLEDKPSQAVIDKLKESGYRWNPSEKIWAHPVYSDSARTTRIEAEKLYQDVCQMVRQEKGIDAGPDKSR